MILRQNCRTHLHSCRRRGVSYVEVIVASVVFSIALTGIAATNIAQERMMRALENRVRVVLPLDRSVTVTRPIDPQLPPLPYGSAVDTSIHDNASHQETIHSRAVALLSDIEPQAAMTLETFDGRPDRIDPALGIVVRPRGFSSTDSLALGLFAGPREFLGIIDKSPDFISDNHESDPVYVTAEVKHVTPP